MKLLIVLPLLFAANFAAETRFKVGNKRWAFQINTSDGKHQREEFVDENGISYGKFSFSNGTDPASMSELRYKFNPNGEPDFVFYHGTEKEGEENRDMNEGSQFPEFNYSSINKDMNFAGHVIFKIGSSTYNFNFKTGDKKENREEALSEDGMLMGKYTMMDENGNIRVVRYRFNMTGMKPTFEVSMDKTESENHRINLFKPYGPNSQPIYGDALDNRLARHRMFVPPSFRPPQRGITRANNNNGNVQAAQTNNIIGKDGNWYSRRQQFIPTQQ